jgi:hypothetical protein
VEISKREIYIRREKKWSTVRLSSNGKQLATYIMKQTESALRALTNFKHKLTADINTAGELNALLKLSGIYLEDEINRAAKEYFAIKNRKVITVDKNALEKIRLEAFETQEKLTAEENTEAKPAHAQNKKAETPAQATGAFGQIDEFRVAANKELPVLPSPKFEDKWEEFKALLTETEKNALSAVLSGASLSKFAHSQNIMPEILTDGINQKAYDTTGDIILDAGGLGDAVLYEDYARILAKLLTIRE